MALRYTKPEHCEAASQHYSGYSCEPAPGGKNECIGVGFGGQFSDCLKCLENCNNSSLSESKKDDNKGGSSNDSKKNTNGVETLSQQPFYKKTVGKVTIGIGSFLLVCLIIILILKLRKPKSINRFSFGII